MPALATVREPARRQLLGCRPLAGNAPTVALGVEFKNGSVVNKRVDRRDSDGGIGEDLAPFAERLIAGDDQRAALVALGDQLELDFPPGTGGFANEPRRPRREGWRRGERDGASRGSSRRRR